MQSKWRWAWSRPNLTDFVHIFSKRGYLQCVFVHWRDLETKSKSTAYLLENWNSSTTAPDALFSPWWASTASSDRLCCSSWSYFRFAAALSACTLPAYPRLENHPFRRTRASDVGAALPCLRPGFPILASRQSRRQIEASIDRGQSSRTHATGHAVESPSRLRWQPRIIVRYSRGPQPRRNTKWRRPRYTLSDVKSRTFSVVVPNVVVCFRNSHAFYMTCSGFLLHEPREKTNKETWQFNCFILYQTSAEEQCSEST